METIQKTPGDLTGPLSCFRIGQDKRWEPKYNAELYKSTTKRHYPAFRPTRQSRIPSPKPAIIIPTESRIGELTSLTRSHFVKKTFDPVDVNSNAFSRSTNFKMETDEKMMSFETTHGEYFPVRVLDKFRNSKADWRMKMQSCIPQGDKEKVMLPLSNYKHSYNGNDINKLSKVSPSHCTFVSAPILQGDPRTYGDQFETTSGKTFAAALTAPKKLEPIKGVLAEYGCLTCQILYSCFIASDGLNNLSSVHLGDPEKCTYSVTSNQKFHKELPLKRDSPSGPDISTHIVLGDENGRRPLCNYRTTATDSFPLISQTERSQQVNINMGKSSLPEGDYDPKRSHQRFTQTTNKYFFQKPCVAFPNTIVDGSKIRTKSNVDFGTEKAGQYYTTTTKSNFPAKFEPLIKRKGCMRIKSNIPLHYYGNEVNQSTTVTDFSPNSDNRRLFPNPEAINKITKCHIQSRSIGPCEYTTTHNLSYPQKQARNETYEKGKLQKNSITLGNFL